MSLGWSIPVEELKRQIYNYLEYEYDTPITPYGIYSNFDLNTPSLRSGKPSKSWKRRS